MSSPSDPRLQLLINAGIDLASELSLDALLQKIADLARGVIGAKYAAVGVVGPHGALQRFVHSGIAEEVVERIGHLPEGKGVLGVIIEEGEPLRLERVSGHPRSSGFPQHHPVMDSFLGVPIVSRGQVYGRLYLTEKIDAKVFSVEDEGLAMLLAAQAGAAIENARLYREITERSEELARRLRELSSLDSVGRLMVASTPIDEVLDAAVREARVLLGGASAFVALLDEAGDLAIRAAAGSADFESLVGDHLIKGSSKSQAVMEERHAEAVADLSNDPQVSKETHAKLGRPRNGAFAPIFLRGLPIGTLSVYDKRKGSFTEEDLAILQMFSNQVGVAIENERLTEKLKDLAVLEDRERISKELHDGVIQAIYSVGLSLQGSISLVDRDAVRAKDRIDEAISELDNVVRDVRRYIFELQPKTVEEHGLVESIKELARDAEVNSLATVEVEIHAEVVDSLKEPDQGHVLQIVREVLSNVARHAAATEVRIVLSKEDSENKLWIFDNGRGFDPDTVTKGQGLDNITYRASNLGGKFHVYPMNPRGTRHEVTWPED